MIILNENRFAEGLLENGLGEVSPFYAMTILARYFWHTKHCKKRIIKQELLRFLVTFYPRYEIDRFNWMNTIDKITDRVDKTAPMFETTGVKITKPEMSVIKDIKNEVLERLCFTMLCVAKLHDQKNNQNNGWVNLTDKEIFQMARLTYRRIDVDVKIGTLCNLGLIELPVKNDNLNFRITFIQNDADEELFVSDFRELGYEYELYNGENYIRCAECGILTRGNKNKTKKYCSDCNGSASTATRFICCEDCGIQIEIPAKNHKTTRCRKCQAEHDRMRKRNWKREYDQAKPTI